LCDYGSEVGSPAATSPIGPGLKTSLRVMKIIVAQISEDEGLNLDYSYPEGELRLAGEDSLLVAGPQLFLQATRAGEKVQLAGSVNAKVAFECDRCLKPLEMPISQSFDLLYIPPLGVGEEKELGDDDLSTSFYQGEAIDLDDLVREQIELALPMARLCSETCLGLCPSCGANLNQGKCSCATEEVDPRWAALKQLRYEEPNS
jgi:uncharacterized protein